MTSCSAPLSTDPGVDTEHPLLSLPGTLPNDATAIHFDCGWQCPAPLAEETAIIDLSAENNFLNLDDQPTQLPVVNEDALDMAIVNDNNALLHDPLFPPSMGNQTLPDMLPIYDNGLFLDPSPPLPGLSEVMPVVDNQVLHNQPLQLPVTDDIALAMPLTTSVQVFNPDPPYPYLSEELQWHLCNQARSSGCCDPGLSLLSTSSNTSGGLPGLPHTFQLSTALARDPAPPPTATNLPLTAPDSLQPPRQEKGMTQASITRKRPLDQAQVPIRPAKRLPTIRPKPLPAEPSSTGTVSTMTSNPSPEPSMKQTNIPPNMLGAFKVEGSEASESPRKRTQSAKVCLRCQILRKGCDGVFPCKSCRDSGKRRQLVRYIDLPCIDADLMELNCFSVYIPFYQHALSLDDYSTLVDGLTAKVPALMEANSMLLHTALQYLGKGADYGMLSALFSSFTLTGLPPSETSPTFCSPLLPIRVSPWRPNKLIWQGAHPRGFTVLPFVVALTQTRNLAKLTGVTEREVELWSALLARRFFRQLAKSMGRVSHGKASPEEKLSLRFALAAVLFVAEVRTCTYISNAGKRIVDEILQGLLEVEVSIPHALLICANHIFKSPDQRHHLRLWAQHWFRKLYGDWEAFPESVVSVISLYTLLSSMDLSQTSDARFATEGLAASKPNEEAPADKDQKTQRRRDSGDGYRVGKKERAVAHLFSQSSSPTVETFHIRLGTDLILEYPKRIYASKLPNLKKFVKLMSDECPNLEEGLFFYLALSWMGVPLPPRGGETKGKR